MKNVSTSAFKRAIDTRKACPIHIADAAHLLYSAGRTTTQISVNDLPWFKTADLDDAYFVQHLNIRRELETGARVVGHKVGLTSEAMQRQLGVDEPDSGILLDRMLVSAGATLDAGSLFQPRVEAEFGVVIGSELSGESRLGEQTVREAVSGTFLALEILDTRYPSWLISLWQSIADNASCAAAVQGPVNRDTPIDRLKDQRIELVIDGTEVAGGVGEAVLGDPIRSVLWLIERLHRAGLGLHEGDLVITGAVHASIGLDGVSEVRARSSEYADAWVTIR